MADDYQMLEELGSGSFGVVYRALERATGEYVAIKHIDLEGSDDDIREIQQEISLLSTCSSDFVTRYKASFVRGVKLWIVMEYLGGGSCLDLLKPGPMLEGYIAVIMRELLQGLDYLHSTGKIHRDIKAANILLSETGQVKIADFGVAAQLTNIKSQRLTFVGTPFWMAPEVIQEAGYDFHADIWSLGITAMELALGAPPRSDVHPMKVLFLIPKEKPPRLEGPRFSKDFKDFVALCLNKDPEKRPTAHTLLKHPFIKRAGHTDMLQDLVLKVRKFERQEDEMDRDTRYYEETLRSLPDVGEEDEWVFDTIKPTTNVRMPANPTHTVKRRRLDRVSSQAHQDIATATAALEDMSLETSPLADSSESWMTPTKSFSTIRTPKTRTSTQRKSSGITARKISLASPTARRMSSRSSPGVAPAVRKSSHLVKKQPLALDTSFGNSPSTVRQFRRVSSGTHATTEARVPSPQDSVFDSDSENKAPEPEIAEEDAPRAIVTKEGILGRRCFAKCVDPAFQEAYAATADAAKRAALGRVGEAWAALDELDAEGELMLLKAMMDRVQADPRLASALLPQRVVNAQLASLRSTPKKSRGELTTTPPSSPTKGLGSVRGGKDRANRQPTPGRLVMNPQNPHLKKMRSHQRLREEKEAELATINDRLPGRVEAGLEHVGMLTSVLYQRWSEGLGGRWPA